MKVRLRTTAATPPGQYTAVLSFTSDGVAVPARYSFNVLEEPKPVKREASAAVPPIPGMDILQNRMVLDGMRFGRLGESMAFGCAA